MRRCALSAGDAAYKKVLRATEGLPLAEGYQVMRSQACPTYHKMRTSQ